MSLTLSQITEKAALRACIFNEVESDFDTSVEDLAWAITWNRVDATVALQDLVSAAIQIERMNR